MKKNFFFLAAAIVFFSCNSGTQENKSADSGTAVTNVDTTPPAPAAFVPFDAVRVRVKVKDYAKWYTGFMGSDSARLANGIHKYSLGRGLDADSNSVIIVSKIDDLQKAKDFYASSYIKTAMQQSGVTGAAKIDYLKVIKNDTTAMPQDTRVSVVHHVKNFDAWLKVYDGEGEETRVANGMVDRAMARGLEDSNMVTVVFVVTDMAKAKARSNSPELKKLMTDAGVDSAPDIFFYRFIQKF